VTICSSIEGSSVKEVARYYKISCTINGFYQLESEENLGKFVAAMTSPAIAEEVSKVIKKGDFAFRVKECEDRICMTEDFNEKRKDVIYKLDEALDYSNKELGVEETRLLTKISPGKYKMVAKSKKTGKVWEMCINFTETGASETLTCGAVNAKVEYRRCPDLEGRWKVVSKEGEAQYLDACDVPEPMKSEMMASKDCFETERLSGGRIRTKTTSKFFPGEMVIKYDEEWEVEMPGIGTMKGVATQCKDTILVCMKIMGKTINAKEKISGDFMVQECEVDGIASSRMKIISVRQ